jgi:hypothetical protein
LADAFERRQGSIVWVAAPDLRGRNPKTRPFVILNNPQDIRAGATLVGVAVTSTFREPLGDELVPPCVPRRRVPAGIRWRVPR